MLRSSLAGTRHNPDDIGTSPSDLDLSDVDLSDIELSDVDLSNIDLSAPLLPASDFRLADARLLFPPCIPTLDRLLIRNPFREQTRPTSLDLSNIADLRAVSSAHGPECWDCGIFNRELCGVVGALDRALDTRVRRACGALIVEFQDEA